MCAGGKVQVQWCCFPPKNACLSDHRRDDESPKSLAVIHIIIAMTPKSEGEGVRISTRGTSADACLCQGIGKTTIVKPEAGTTTTSWTKDDDDDDDGDVIVGGFSFSGDVVSTT